MKLVTCLAALAAGAAVLGACSDDGKMASDSATPSSQQARSDTPAYPSTTSPSTSPSSTPTTPDQPVVPPATPGAPPPTTPPT